MFHPRSSRPVRALPTVPPGRGDRRRGRYLAALVIGAGVLAGCSDVPTNYNERAEANFMVGCEDGSPASYCECVWTKLEATVPWGDFDEFDKSQQTADEEGREIEIPPGIQAAIDDCSNGADDGEATSTTEAQTTTTEAG